MVSYKRSFLFGCPAVLCIVVFPLPDLCRTGHATALRSVGLNIMKSEAMEVKPEAEPGFRKGDPVDVFYRISLDSGHYFPVANAACGTLRPRFGRTDGWLRAELAEDWIGGREQASDANASGAVRVQHTHKHWVNPSGELLDTSNPTNMEVTMSPRDVRPATDGRLEAAPTLSIFIVRWGGEATRFNQEEWGGAGASVSEQYIAWFLDRCVYPCLGPDYEVHSAFIESGADMTRLYAGTVAASMRGRHRCGCYFLWPTSFQDGTEDQSGMVPHVPYFECVKGFEAAGVPTRFPHPSQLYNTLLSKDWQPSLCLVPSMRVPPCTVVNRASIVADPKRAAATVQSALEAIRKLRYAKKSEPAGMAPAVGGNEQRRGVAKLGYAWEAAHVVIWRGTAQLEAALLRLSQQYNCTDATVLVQDYAPNDFEMRVFVLRGELVKIAYTNFARRDPDGYCRDFLKYARAKAITEWFEGDEPAMGKAERKVHALVARWLVWLRCRSCEMPPAMRMDFLIRRTAPGDVDVHTLELTELGFSMLGWDDGPKLVFGALLESCFEDTGPSDAEAERLRLFRAGPTPPHPNGYDGAPAGGKDDGGDDDDEGGGEDSEDGDDDM